LELVVLFLHLAPFFVVPVHCRAVDVGCFDSGFLGVHHFKNDTRDEKGAAR
jgi:hypothetical protein